MRVSCLGEVRGGLRRSEEGRGLSEAVWGGADSEEVVLRCRRRGWSSTAAPRPPAALCTSHCWPACCPGQSPLEALYGASCTP